MFSNDKVHILYTDDLVHDCSISIDNTLEILRFHYTFIEDSKDQYQFAICNISW